tara:strand:- start:1838 stop:3916 length:2079 start_codon:yes stop_codon:yes gene_type:complete
MSIWETIKGTRVFKVSGVYAIAVWVLLQLADILLAAFSAPGWVMPVFTILLLLGFPIVAIVAWAGDKSDLDEGSTVENADSKRSIKTNQLIFALIFVMGAVLIFLLYERINFDGSSDSPDQVPPETGSEVRLLRGNSGVQGTIRSSILLREGYNVGLGELVPLGVERRSIAISPDGTALCYVIEEQGVSKLVLRRLYSYQVSEIEGTSGAFNPFFSPDGQWIGFFTPSQLKKVSINGGAPITLADTTNAGGATWNSDNQILVSEREGYLFSMVNSEEGTKKEIYRGAAHHSPFFLPDGKRALITLQPGPGIDLLDTQSKEIITLLNYGYGATYSPSGHILYHDGPGISAISFDEKLGQSTGTSFPVLDDVRTVFLGSQLSYSLNGTLVYLQGTDQQVVTPMWVDKNGTEREVTLESKVYGNFRVSPDGSKVAMLVVGKTTDIWIHDFDREYSLRRFTTGGGVNELVWAHDSSSIVYGVGLAKEAIEERGIWSKSLDGSPAKHILPGMDNIHTSSISNDGLLFIDKLDKEGSHIYSVNIKEADPVAKEFVKTGATEWGPAISPDGEFVAYTSDESGQYQIYVKEFPPTEKKWLVSSGYGEEPRWSRDGSKIYYRRGDEWLSVEFMDNPSPSVGKTTVEFEGPYANVFGLSYQLSADEQEILVLKRPQQGKVTSINLVSNWFSEIQAIGRATGN